MRLERFTDKAQEAFQEAQEIMHEQHHTQLDVEHIFLAMLRQKDGLASRALDRLGVDPDTISQRVERELEKSPKVYGQYGYGNQVYITPRTQRLVKRAPAVQRRAGRVDHPAQQALGGKKIIALSHSEVPFDMELLFEKILIRILSGACGPQVPQETPTA